METKYQSRSLEQFWIYADNDFDIFFKNDNKLRIVSEIKPTFKGAQNDISQRPKSNNQFLMENAENENSSSSNSRSFVIGIVFFAVAVLLGLICLIYIKFCKHRNIFSRVWLLLDCLVSCNWVTWFNRQLRPPRADVGLPWYEAVKTSYRHKFIQYFMLNGKMIFKADIRRS